MKGARGFTLLELMLVVGIMATLAGMALGFGGTFNREESLKEVARNVVGALAQGRAEAVRTSTKWTVNFGAGTAQKIHVFIDQNNDFLWEFGEYTLFTYPRAITSGDTFVPSGLTAVLQPGVTMASAPSQPISASNPRQAETVIFDFQGYSIDSQGNPFAGTLCVRDSGIPGGAVRAITLTAAGAARVITSTQAKVLCP